MRISTGVAAFGLAASMAMVPAQPASASTCPDHGHGLYDGFVGGFSASGARIRTGPWDACTVVGLGYPGQQARYHCYKTGQNNATYSWIDNLNTGKSGWVADSLLTFGGAWVHC